MHPRSPYCSPPDFTALAEAYPPLKTHLFIASGGVTIDFKDNVAQRRLTEALLQRDFGVSLTLPDDRLCPPVPNRSVVGKLNYILWLQDIMQATALADPRILQRQVRCIDIGTGASAIYPLLGCRTNPRWCFTATDIDEVSLRYARLNVHQNSLEGRIDVVQSARDDAIFPPASITAMARGVADMADLFHVSSAVEYDFTMCNPPFYSSQDDIVRSAEAKEFEPAAVCTGADVEMITPGGEVTFVGRMVAESLQLGVQCRWYTSMLGKLSSLAHIVALLRKHQIDNYACTEFVQGQTRRWAIAWSLTDVRLPDSIARIAAQSIMPPRNSSQQTYAQVPADGLVRALRAVLASIAGLTLRPLPLVGPPSDAEGVLVAAARDTWSRAARRRPEAIPSGAEAALVCRVRCIGDTVVVVDWVRGTARALYESFASHVWRKLGAAIAGDAGLNRG